MTTITPMLLKSFRADLDAAIAGLAKKYDLSELRSGRASYTAGSFTMKIEGVAAGGKSKAASMYEDASFLGLPPLGFSFKQGGRSFTTTGLNTTGTKVLCARDDGTTYLFKVDGIKRLAKGQA